MKRAERDRAADEAADFIRRQYSSLPRFGLILGTGSDSLVESISIETVIDYREIPHFPESTALGHRGQLVCGNLANQPIIAMQGRFHLYEGYPVALATLPVHVLARLGIEFLFVTNAAGGINPAMQSGDIMLIESHIDLMFQSALAREPAKTGHPNRRDEIYDRELLRNGMTCGRQQDFPVHQGVYAAMLGPNYETRAEYRLLKTIGADAAGMSTVPEVIAAADYNLRVLGLSLITNIANPDALQPTSGEEVIRAAQTGAPKLNAIVIDAITHNA